MLGRTVSPLALVPEEPEEEEPLAAPLLDEPELLLDELLLGAPEDEEEELAEELLDGSLDLPPPQPARARKAHKTDKRALLRRPGIEKSIWRLKCIVWRCRGKQQPTSSKLRTICVTNQYYVSNHDAHRPGVKRLH